MSLAPSDVSIQDNSTNPNLSDLSIRRNRYWIVRKITLIIRDKELRSETVSICNSWLSD